VVVQVARVVQYLLLVQVLITAAEVVVVRVRALVQEHLAVELLDLVLMELMELLTQAVVVVLHIMQLVAMAALV
jgi:hypothetical protein